MRPKNNKSNQKRGAGSGLASRSRNDCSPRMTLASPHASANLRSPAMRATRYLRSPSDPRGEPHIHMTALTRRTRSFEHSHALRASKRASSHVCEPHARSAARSCTGAQIEEACGDEAGAPPASDPLTSTVHPMRPGVALSARAQASMPLRMEGSLERTRR